MTDMMKMTVTTLDLHAGYEIVGPVCGSCREQSDPDQGFLQALREIRKSAALLQADAVIGLRQTAVPMSDGTGRFHVQLYGTAVRKTAQAQAETAAGAASIAGILPGMRVTRRARRGRSRATLHQPRMSGPASAQYRALCLARGDGYRRSWHFGMRESDQQRSRAQLRRSVLS